MGGCQQPWGSHCPRPRPHSKLGALLSEEPGIGLLSGSWGCGQASPWGGGLLCRSPPTYPGLSQAQSQQLVGFLLLGHLGFYYSLLCLPQREFTCVSALLPEPLQGAFYREASAIPPPPTPARDRAGAGRHRRRRGHSLWVGRVLPWICVCRVGPGPRQQKPCPQQGQAEWLVGWVFTHFLGCVRPCCSLNLTGSAGTRHLGCLNGSPQASGSRPAIPLSACMRVGQGAECQDGAECVCLLGLASCV